jgi:hypothetical protein
MIPALRCLAALLALSASAALAQSYPSKPVRILLGFPVGQATDILARVVATRLSAQHGQQFYVENRPGAAGIIATEMAAKAEPDGYTLLATSSGPLTVNPALYAKLPYDVPRDFVVLAGLGIVPYVVVVNANSPIKDIKGLVAYAKANPGKLNYASGGSGVTNHLVTEMFKAAAGIDMQHVPTRRSRGADRSRRRPGRRDVRDHDRDPASGERRQAARARGVERQSRLGRARAPHHLGERLSPASPACPGSRWRRRSGRRKPSSLRSTRTSTASSTRRKCARASSPRAASRW